MNKALRKSYCANKEWLGRADCSKCHIRHLMLFSGLPESAFDDTLLPIDHFVFPNNSVLYEAGSREPYIYSIRRGLVKLLHLAPDGSQRIVRIMGPGAAVGLEMLDGGDGYRHSAVAVNDADVCRIPLATVMALQSEYPQICHQVRERLQEHLDRADEWIIALGTGPARERVVHLLLMMSDLSTDPNGDIQLLGREDMAAIVGTTVETVSRIIADLKRRRLLYKVTADNLYRCATEALRAIAREDAN
jgi:CRP-like cAMP-binding protein